MADGRLTERPDGIRNPLQTIPLLDAMTENRFDAVFGGGRRDEGALRAKERIFSLRNAFGQWDPKRQRPEPGGTCTTAGTHRANTCVFPLSNGPNSTSGGTSPASRCCLAPLYYAHEREVYDERDGMWMTSGSWGGPRGRTVETRRCATAPSATDPPPAQSFPTPKPTRPSSTRWPRPGLTERGATCGDDRVSEAAMEDRKREGYF